MRRQTVILTAFFALFLAVLSPIRATAAPQEDPNAGIMLAATSGQAFTSLEAYARDQWNKTTLLEGQEVTYYELGLVDLPDPGVYDCWLWAGGLIQQTTLSNGTTSKGGALFQGVVVRLPNGNWASSDEIGSVNKAWGYWPVYFRVNDGSFTSASFYGTYANTGNISVQDAANFMANLRSFLADVKNLAITGAVINSLDVARLNDFETYDADGGGVIDLVEWVRGGNLSDWKDDVRASDPGCKCGACCSCECVCGKWSGAECAKTPDACACHSKEIVCTCSNYCCKHTCACEKCDDGEHSAHKNDNGECDGTFENCPDCHEEENPEEECECANYCCKHTCACEKCADGTHSAHKNDNGECDGTFENCPDCHEEENPEEECTCANYCCYHTCACPIHKDKEASEHSQHGNGATSCDGTTGNGGCACHETTGDEEECTCAKYCCYHACECKRCASLPAGSHSQHKNNSPTCDGTNGSGGCSCHETTDDGKFEAPGDQEFDVPEDKKNQKFLDAHEEFKPAITRLEKAFEDKYGVKNITKYFSDDFSGSLPSWELELPDDWGVARVDFNELKKYDEQLTTVRAVLVALVYLLTAAYVLQTLRKLV